MCIFSTLHNLKICFCIFSFFLVQPTFSTHSCLDKNEVYFAAAVSCYWGLAARSWKRQLAPIDIRKGDDSVRHGMRGKSGRSQQDNAAISGHINLLFEHNSVDKVGGHYNQN